MPSLQWWLPLMLFCCSEQAQVLGLLQLLQTFEAEVAHSSPLPACPLPEHSIHQAPRVAAAERDREAAGSSAGRAGEGRARPAQPARCLAPARKAPRRQRLRTCNYGGRIDCKKRKR